MLDDQMETCVFFVLDVLKFNLLNLIKYLRISNKIFIENNNNLWTFFVKQNASLPKNEYVNKNNNKIIFILKIALNI